ncbi:MAG: hypothetical protein ACJ8G1_13490 [Vitreoscilla sp.]
MCSNEIYGWCATWQCFAAWWGTPFANNLFTLLGAIATFVAALFALRFSQSEAHRRAADEDARAKVTAAANLAKMRDARDSLAEIARLCGEAHATDGAPGVVKVLFNVTGRWEVIPRLDPGTLLLLVPLPNQVAIRLSRAFGVIDLLERQRPIMQAFNGRPAGDDVSKFADRLGSQLRSAVEDLSIATGTLERSAS